jgi:hypothetical protein
MTARGTPPITFGFLTVMDDPEQGLFGGYLALNAAGRPLEFHCTAPVKANRAQEILYGSTLAAYLQGDLIGGTLLARAKTPPLVVCTDRAPVLAVRREIETPVILAMASSDHAAAADSSQPLQVSAMQSGRSALGERSVASASLLHFSLGANRAAVLATHEGDRRRVEETCAALAEFDLLEPFARIREALQEAGAAAKPARQTAAA